MDSALKLLPLVGRILLALIFVLAGIRKLASTDATAALMASHGIPFANILVFSAIAVELGGGLLLVVGWHGRGAALVLFLYTLSLALIFHAFWGAPAAAQRTEYAFFFGHLSMMGGMLYVVAFGPGPISVDESLGRKVSAATELDFGRSGRMNTG
jgi:putative oxidoreductase